MLARPPGEITVGEIVKVLEGGKDIVDCIENPEKCKRSGDCTTRGIWAEASKAMYEKLNSMNLSEILKTKKAT